MGDVVDVNTGDPALDKKVLEWFKWDKVGETQRSMN